MKKSLLNIKTKYEVLPKQVKASFWFLFCAFIQKAISVLTTPIFTRIMTPEEYGGYNVFQSWMSIVSIVITLNISYGVYTQGLVKFDKEKELFSSSLQGLTLTMVCIAILFYSISTSFWNGIFSMTTIQGISMFIIIWASAAFNFWATDQRVKLNYSNLVKISVLVALVQPIVGVIFVVMADDKITARIISLTLVDLFAFAGLFFVQLRRGKKFFSKRFWIYALSFNLPLLPHYLSQVVLSSSDRIMINKMTGDTEAGIYSLAYSVAWIMVLFNTALMQTLSPWIFQKIKDKKIEEISKIGYSTMIIIGGINIFLISIGPEVVSFFAPPSYYDARWIIPPVALSVYFSFCYNLFSTFQFYYKKTGLIAFASVLGAAGNILLNYLLIPIYGYIVAGYTTLACYIMYSLAHYLLMHRICKQEFNNRGPYKFQYVAIITVIVLLVGLGLLFSYYNNFVRYIIVASIVIVVIIIRRKIFSNINNIIIKRKLS